ncbi:MAG: hypothetical protein JNM56_06675 [Planctomycetia bacterium]|nr:hypothetical protein [Planctomycetia bacterium]
MALHNAFPSLADEGFTETSPATTDYNCIAWAAGRTDDVWWPDAEGLGYWPEGVLRGETLEAFYLAFESLGYVRCAGGELEPEFEKVALYALDGRPKHAARQLPDGSWTSKLGQWIDITHSLRGVAGPVYGQVAGFLKRPRPSP